MGKPTCRQLRGLQLAASKVNDMAKRICTISISGLLLAPHSNHPHTHTKQNLTKSLFHLYKAHQQYRTANTLNTHVT